MKCNCFEIPHPSSCREVNREGGFGVKSGYAFSLYGGAAEGVAVVTEGVSVCAWECGVVSLLLAMGLLNC